MATRRLPLTNSHGKTAIIDKDDYPRVQFIKWYLLKAGYVQGYLPQPIGKMVYLHRFIIQAKDYQEYDHRNGNKLDCRKQNIRLCTRSQNQANRDLQSNNTTGYKGVYLHKPTGRYQIKIRFQGKMQYFGYHTDPIEAAKIYNQEAIRLFGEFAKLNEL